MVSRDNSTSFKVLVNGRMCVEQKVLFATVGQKGENGFLVSFRDIQRHNFLRECAGVT